ncbi:AEC family transporter [Ramlibacter aquaticus]|uniref:AEC family transporter n=1 Tax=Ramlibacter aquaticus TaxID=2780094 RepID=A0ABR9SI76_9BURK|nr:AEC family transporter [Ramlibacter aquaticus]
MGPVLGVTLPFFALVLCGWGAARARLVPMEAIPGLNIFVLYFALPAMLFKFAADTPIASLVDGGTLATWVSCALVMTAFSVVTTRRGRIGWNDASFGALVAAFPNSGFMGVPLLVAMLGQRAAAPAIVALSVDMVLTSSLCIALSRLDLQGAGQARHALAQALRGMAANPLPWAILLGSLSSGLHLAPPGPLATVVAMLAQAASPVALFALGCVLARAYDQARRSAAAAPPAGMRSDVPRVVAYKLLVHPLLVLGAGRLAIALGLPLDPYSALVLVLVAALPSASNVPMLAERFGADAGRVARIVMGSTAAAFVSFTLVVLGVVPASLIVGTAVHAAR